MKKLLTHLILLLPALSVSAQVYNVKDYGAVADTTRLSTVAIQNAIDDCSTHGGGTVWIPAGNYLCTTVFLKDNVTLHLDVGSTLYASRKVSDYASLRRKVSAADNDYVEILVGAVNARNIAVTGKGTLNCRAERTGFRREPQLAITDSVTGREIANAAKYGADYQSKFKKVPPFPGAINFRGCTNVHIRDIQVIESSFWSVHLQGCDRVYVDGIYIESDPDNGVNADGLDIDGCNNVSISNCVINTGDDALCLKTTSQGGKPQSCKGIAITNCHLTSSSAALKIGTESHGNFEDITISNCIINSANRGLNMIIRDGGTVRNVTISNLIIRTVRKATFWWGNGDPLWFTIQKRGNQPSAGSIENVTIQDVIAYGQSGMRLEGFDNTIKNIRFRNVQLFMEPETVIDKRARNGFLFYGVDGLQMIDCSVKWNKEHPQDEWESAYLFEKVTNAELTRVRGEQAPNRKYEVFRYKNVRGMWIDGVEKSNINE